jgi:hypothetical protein
MAGDYMRTYGAPAAQLRGEFFSDTERDGFASVTAGRDIFRSIDRVRIVIPGAIASIVVKNVDESHRERWPEAYAAFKAGQEAPLQGTPLEEWPILNKAMVAELRHLQIRTVEELANLSDVAVQHIGMGGQMLRTRARGFLDDAEREAHNSQLMAENDQLRSRVATLEGQVEALGQQFMLLSQREQQFRDTPNQRLTYVPGEHDPVEIAKAAAQQSGGQQSGAIAGGGASSALDALAALPGGRRRPQRKDTTELAVATMPPLEGAGEAAEAS